MLPMGDQNGDMSVPEVMEPHRPTHRRPYRGKPHPTLDPAACCGSSPIHRRDRVEVAESSRPGLVVCRGFGLVGEGGLVSVDLGDGVVGGLVP